MKKYIFLCGALLLTTAKVSVVYGAADQMDEKARIQTVWNTLSCAQQDVAIKLNSARSTLTSKIESLDGELMSAPFFDENKEISTFRTQKPFDELNEVLVNLGTMLQNTQFEDQILYQHIQDYLITLQKNVKDTLQPFRDAYTQLQNQENTIVDEDTTLLREQVEGYKKRVGDLFPKDMDAVKKAFFGNDQKEKARLAEEAQREEERQRWEAEVQRLAEQQRQDALRIAEEKRIEEERKQLIYQEMVNTYIAGANNHLTIWTEGLLEKLNARRVQLKRAQPYANLLEGINADPESSMAVWNFFKNNNHHQVNTLFTLLKRFYTNEEPPVVSVDDIVQNVERIENNNNGIPLSTLRHINHWKKNRDTQKNYPSLLEGMTWLHRLDPENGLSLLVLGQGEACMSGLMGRTLYQLMQKLEGNLEGLRQGTIQLYGENA